MNFELGEERQMLQDSLRRFLEDGYTPELGRSLDEGSSGFSAELWSGLAELGVIGALFTEEQGGFGGGGFDLAVVFEELGRRGAVDPLIDTGVLGGGLLAMSASDAHRSLLERVISGEVQLALAHAEPDSRYELARVTTTARESDDGFVLDGRKAVVVNAPAADRLIVVARLSGEAADEAGLGLFLVSADAKGLERTDYALASGGRASEIVLDGVAIEGGARLDIARAVSRDGEHEREHDDALGENAGDRVADDPSGRSGEAVGDNAAFAALELVHARATLAISAEALGLMESIRSLTADYLGTRKQFGKPIGAFQALQHRMADVLIEIEQARSAVINLAGHLDAPRELRERHVSATKHTIGTVGRLVAEEGIQMHGGIGVTMEYELGHLARRLVLIDHRFGDTTHHLERYIALALEPA